MIANYRNDEWCTLVHHFRHYLAEAKAIATRNKVMADDTRSKLETTFAEYRDEYRKLNAHLLGINTHTQTGVCFYRHDDDRPASKGVNLDYHANGHPILWQWGKPSTVTVPARLRDEPVQPEHITLQLEIMSQAA